jgi:glycosidase
MATFEFHVSRRARDRYQFDDTLFTITGNVVFANFRAARVFAQKMNDHRDLVTFPERAVKPGQINAMGLVDEVLHHLVDLYRQDYPDVMQRALGWLDQRVGQEAVDRTLRRFADNFPAVAVYRREIELDRYIAGQTGETPNRQIVLEELLLLWLANVNPANAPFLELFEDAELQRDTAYPKIVNELRAFFDTQPPFGPEGNSLIAELRAPALANPHSLEGQLTFILERWGSMIGQTFYKLLSSLDVIKEEHKQIFLGPGPTQVPVYDEATLRELAGADGLAGESIFEAEAFSPELGWMPSLVLMAKNIYVWLDQLSRRYQRNIYRLDHIPDEELDQLARWGFTGLWLIGVWERSPASQRIKVLCGNPDAVPSAYSLYDYTIADDLGGEAAYQDLKSRAWQRGIRMASDMVPNHVGIASRWTVEHPDWFVSREDNPYPWYTYGGPDLSHDDRVGIFIEDHYYDRTDAAVTFKRVDRHTGHETYVYHGNDGTSMPWNDTAQLNYLNPELREAVIQTILHVARQFPVIRFDAAMTLAKRHYQRLWFPEPGSGGAIPTRSEQGLTREQFNEAMPAEFWREVVDRVAAEAPDTLLLAEAFWLLEGYFVRTLGMHRVYNSAFMNMLRDEENSKYRQVMKNTLEFDPEVLRRFVNFMNNPDERTAVDQFGKGDKYIGVCTLMVTMPGLPMIGHGQVEGYGEKYGMEFRRPLWDESPDPGLIERHEREIFPLMHQRPLFAGVDQFLLYDFFTPDGAVNEDVFAYSNRLGDERALVLYHNCFADTRGWVRFSAAFAEKTGQGDEKVLVQRSLAEGLGLELGDDWFSIFRDQATGLEYIRANGGLRDEGMYVELGAYRRHIFIGFRQVQDTPATQYAALAAYLDGRGVPSVDEALREVQLQPIQRPFSDLVHAEFLRRLLSASASQEPEPDPALMNEVSARLRGFLEEAARIEGRSVDLEPVVESGVRYVQALISLPMPAGVRTNGSAATSPSDTIVVNGLPLPTDEDEATSTVTGSTSAVSGDGGESITANDAPVALPAAVKDSPARRAGLLGWALTRWLGSIVDPEQPADHTRALFDEWLLGRTLQRTFLALGLDESAAYRAMGLTQILLCHERELSEAGDRSPRQVMEGLLKDGDVRDFLGVNRYRDVLWFNQERFDDLIGGLLATALVTLTAEAAPEEAEISDTDAVDHAQAATALAQTIQEAELRSAYQLERLLRLLPA